MVKYKPGDKVIFVHAWGDNVVGAIRTIRAYPGKEGEMYIPTNEYNPDIHGIMCQDTTWFYYKLLPKGKHPSWL